MFTAVGGGWIVDGHMTSVVTLSGKLATAELLLLLVGRIRYILRSQGPCGGFVCSVGDRRQ